MERTVDPPNGIIDYAAEEITNLTPNVTYAISVDGAGGGYAKIPSADGTLKLYDNWINGVSGGFRIAVAGTHKVSVDGKEQIFTLQRPAAPNVTGVDETVVGKRDGKITGVNNTMEYSVDDGLSWQPCAGTEITDLAPGSYKVRVKQTGSAFVGAAADITIKQGPAATRKLTVKIDTFDTVVEGYAQPTAKPISIENTGNSDVTISNVSPGVGPFTISKEGNTTIQPNTIDTSWEIQPNTGLTYDENIWETTITVTYNGTSSTDALGVAQMWVLKKPNLTVTAPTFSAVQAHYAQPAALPITIANSGSKATITDVKVSGNAFTIGGNGDTVDAYGSITSWTIQPAPNLPADIYKEKISVTYDNGVVAKADVAFIVKGDPAPVDPPANPDTPINLLEDAEYTFGGNFELLEKVYLNDTEMPQDNITEDSADLGWAGYSGTAGKVSKGSTIVLLYKEFLQTLPSGKYTLKLEFDNGNNGTESGNLNFTVKNDPPAGNPGNPPAQTGFAITLSASPREGGSAAGAGSYAAGTAISVTAKPNRGYVFDHWSESGKEVSRDAAYAFTVSGARDLVAHFVAEDDGENTYPSVYSAVQTPKIVKGIAYVTLLEKDAKQIVARIPKGRPEGRIARIEVKGDFSAVKLRISPAALTILDAAQIDAFEMKSAAVELYMDGDKLAEIAAEARKQGGKTWQLLMQPAEGKLTLSADFHKGGKADFGKKGKLLLRVPLEGYAKAKSAVSWYDSARKKLHIVPSGWGSIALEGGKTNWDAHWARDYMAYAAENKLGVSGKPDEAYKDGNGKTYTRAAFAEALLGRVQKGKTQLRNARAAYPFADNTNAAAVALQRMGVVAPLSDGSFGGSKPLTNAQAAAWLSRLDWLQCDPQLAYGWTLSDDGKAMYHTHTGKLLTGKQSLDGKSHTFDKNGFLLK